MTDPWLDGESEQVSGRVDVAAGPSWDELALAQREAFDASLRDAGLADHEVGEALAVRDDVASVQTRINDEIEEFWATTDHQYFDTPPEVEELYRRRFEARQRLRNVFMDRSFKTEQVGVQDVRIPLFVLSAANATGCTAQLAIGRQTAGEIGWSVTLFGTGLGGGGVIKASANATFTCAGGETKVVFVPVRVPVEKVTLLEKGQPVRGGWRIDASRLEKTGALGVRVLPPESNLPSGQLAETYPLVEDHTGAIATYTYEYEGSTKIGGQIGLKISGVDLSLKSEVQLTRSVTLTFGLRAGFDYELHLAQEGQGVVWAPVVRAAASVASP